MRFASLFLITIVFGFGFTVCAQDSLKVVELKEVELKGNYWEDFTIGAKVKELDSMQIAQATGQTMVGLLQQQSSIYLKEYGNGMLASITFRGTSASHTAVLWNGININSATLGQSDFNLYPSNAFQSVQLQYGSASSLFGTDALGGTVHLKTNLQSTNKTFHGQIAQQFGSFGQRGTQIKWTIAKNRLQSSTNLYHNYSDNNFTYKNTAKPGYPTEQQNNARIIQYGLIQSFQYKFSSKNQISYHFWGNWADRQIQPTMSNDSKDQQQDRSVRMVLNWLSQNRWGALDVKLAFIQDYLKFNNFEESLVNRLIGSIEYFKELGKGSLRIGANQTNFSTNYSNYNGLIEETRNDVFASFQYPVLKNWQLCLNIRQAFVKGNAAPIAPSIGSEWNILKNNHHQMVFKTLLSRSYRVPTLNDRYWIPGGKPDLKSELGLSTEVGLLYSFQKDGFKINTELSHYQMWVENWIMWLPSGSYWSPQNILAVQVKGLEADAALSYQNNGFFTEFQIQYAYTESTNQNNLNEYDRSAQKQLPYTPFHRLNISQQIGFKNWMLNFQCQYTDLRYTTMDNEESIPSFVLCHLMLSKKWLIDQHTLSFFLKSNNIEDINYQNYENRAMPGRSFQTGVQWSF